MKGGGNVSWREAPALSGFGKSVISQDAMRPFNENALPN